MKLFSFFFTEVFWGSLLILLGISMIIKTIFGIDLPIVRTIFAILLIYAGISIISNIGSSHKHKTTVAFAEKIIIPEKVDNYYSVMFGKGIIDLTHLQNLDEMLKVKIDVIFGQATLKINSRIPTVIHTKANFGNATFPDNTSVSSESYTYKNYAGQGEPSIKVTANVAFGNLQVIEQ
jgi:predicted membrane protein